MFLSSIARCISSFHVWSHFRFFHFLYPILSSAALMMASLIFNLSVCIYPVNSVSFPFSLFLYKVLLDSCSNRLVIGAIGCVVSVVRLKYSEGYVSDDVLFYSCFSLFEHCGPKSIRWSSKNRTKWLLMYKWQWNWHHELQSSIHCVHKSSFRRWQRKLSQTHFEGYCFLFAY